MHHAMNHFTTERSKAFSLVADVQRNQIHMFPIYYLLVTL